MTEPKKMDLKSMSITEDQKAKLKQLFPEVFTENKIDFDKLKLTLGEEVDSGDERYGMTWPGKNECFRIIQEPSITYQGKTVVLVLKEQVAAFFEVNLRTVENYLSKYAEELAQNGYEIIRGKFLKQLKLLISENDVPETDFGNIKMAPQLGLFDFRAFLNIAMLMTESERAKLLSSVETSKQV